MKNSFFTLFAVLICGVSAFGQKGVDPQTQEIRREGEKTNTGNNTGAPPARSFDWGKGKTKERELLANPYRMNSRRDVLLASIRDVLKERKILIDEAASRPNNGILVTQPFVFAKGAVISQNEINRYAVLDTSETVWTRGQYTLTIEVQSIDGVQNNVSVTAKVEGRSGNGLGSEWTSLQSSGIAEDEFLAKLVEIVTGISPDAPQTEIP
jgi:hypothetical protein